VEVMVLRACAEGKESLEEAWASWVTKTQASPPWRKRAADA
jgi:hypothetical protein